MSNGDHAQVFVQHGIDIQLVAQAIDSLLITFPPDPFSAGFVQIEDFATTLVVHLFAVLEKEGQNVFRDAALLNANAGVVSYLKGLHDVSFPQ